MLLSIFYEQLNDDDDDDDFACNIFHIHQPVLIILAGNSYGV